jgi:formamidopyrimidine-DNA glycosylase
MPELPEAETIVRGLHPHVPGRRVRRVEVVHRDLIRGSSAEFARRLAGARFRNVARRGKNLVLTLGRPYAGSGPGPEAGLLHLVVNLGMSGRLLLAPERAASHPGVLFELDDDRTLIYHDVRRFGRLRLLAPAEYVAWSASLGPEPLSRAFTARRMAEGLAASVSPVRSWLLDQRRVAGVGNIYANEALHLARVHPRAPSSSIPQAGVRRLHRGLRRVLRDAIRARGTTLRDYRTAAGAEGSYEGALRVYGRKGRPCPRCGAPVERLVFGNRSAFLCPRCQPETRR